ncbi:unnamed protein product [Parascedosporium putredinis]|uniref:Phosphate transporter n=1 Tax=Parascedosporium putredinis TaxID=1442378 RepID=A0A9P1GXC4_9PEZI|nr:unnamed protein product [Parascedosporium putredinis]CAI7988890.1 unnamed protein product [Parascedosporium putredinis]
MAALEQYNYIFIITVIFAFLDAWNIGANDVANSFATSISSRCLTMKQAVLIASVTEFSGSVSIGSRVADTIRKKVIDPSLYADHPSVLLLAMMCTVFGSSIFLTIATRYGLPVSTTHSTIGGLVGAATASVGIGKINWGVDGVSQVFLAWIIAPGIAGCLGALLFLFTKVAVLSRHHAVRNALWSIPVYSFLTVGALTMLVAWKGVQVAEEPSATLMIALVFSVAGAAALGVSLFLLPYLWRRIMCEDWPLKWYMAWKGPFLLSRPAPPPTPPASKVIITNYYQGHLTPEELEYVRASDTLLKSVQSSPDGSAPIFLENDDDFILPPPAQAIPSARAPTITAAAPVFLEGQPRPPAGPGAGRHPPAKINSILTWDIAAMHSKAKRYDNRAEHAYSFLQVLTAAAASFVHGANDVSNSAAPLSTAYEVWMHGEVPTQVGVPIWILCLGGGAIVLGLLTYGYHVMRNLGNRLTLISPSRGFCMELASAITVLMATRLALPVSTTQCICGATVGVGLANGDWRSINPRLVAFIYFGWIITLPVTALLSGSMMALVLNAPNWTTNI